MVARDDPSSCSRCGGSSLRQDEDVLDTWFSSALWPFSTLGWPDRTDDLHRFYPNAVLITGFDIIYFWVARMMQMGLHFMDEVPFADTVIHGLVRDASGRKMSKSIGNAIDPLDVIDEHGADPLRLALIQAAAPGHDVPFDPDWVIGARKFGNKIWNAVRFALHHLDQGSVPADGGYPKNPGSIDRWILHRLATVTRRFDELCDWYRFSDAFGLLYNFAWSEVFDWYLEMAKVPLRNPATAPATRATLGAVLRDLLKLFHPAIPFLTEELWSVLVGKELLAGSRWPDPPDTEAVAGVESFQELVTGIRRFKAEHSLAPRVPLTVAVFDPDGLAEPWFTEQLEALVAARPHFAHSPPSGRGFTRIVAGSLEGYVKLEGLIDVAAERARLEKRRHSAASDLTQVRGKLANNSFLERAPAEVVDKEKVKAAELSALVDKLDSQLTELSG
jgi:valyl-tRNA synthetase